MKYSPPSSLLYIPFPKSVGSFPFWHRYTIPVQRNWCELIQPYKIYSAVKFKPGGAYLALIIGIIKNSVVLRSSVFHSWGLISHTVRSDECSPVTTSQVCKWRCRVTIRLPFMKQSCATLTWIVSIGSAKTIFTVHCDTTEVAGTVIFTLNLYLRPFPSARSLPAS